MIHGEDDPEPQPHGVLPSERRRRRDRADRVDPGKSLDRLRRLDVFEWPAETGGVERFGPVAEDFHTVFGVGVDADDIAAGDPDGVTIAAVQGLAERVDQQSRRIDRQVRLLRRQRDLIEEQRDDIETLRERVEALQAELAQLRRD